MPRKESWKVHYRFGVFLRPLLLQAAHSLGKLEVGVLIKNLSCLSNFSLVIADEFQFVSREFLLYMKFRSLSGVHLNIFALHHLIALNLDIEHYEGECNRFYTHGRLTWQSIFCFLVFIFLEKILSLTQFAFLKLFTQKWPNSFVRRCLPRPTSPLDSKFFLVLII